MKLPEHAGYFQEALAICEEFDILKLMGIQCDVDTQLLHQWYATIHFGTDDRRTITWMTRDKRLSAPWSEFCAALGYHENGIQTPVGFRPHGGCASAPSLLQPLYIQGRGIAGSSKDLKPLYDIMHRIYRNVLIPKVGNQDKIYNFFVDLLLKTRSEKGKGVPLDVPDVLWNEMVHCVMSKAVPSLGPYIMTFLNKYWVQHFPGELLCDPSSLIPHGRKRLKVKKHAAPRFEDPETGRLQTLFPESSDSDFELPKADRSSWQKLKAKVKNTFCLQADIQHRLYQSHVNEKIARQRQIQMMRALSLDVQSGSEKTITPEEHWISQQYSRWTDSDDSPPPAAGEDSSPAASRERSPEIQSEQEDDDDDATEESDE